MTRRMRVKSRVLRRSCLLGFFIGLSGLGAATPAFAQTIPDALWTGHVQCQLAVQSVEYAHQEMQTWTITGSPPPSDPGGIQDYPATWTVSGVGGLQRTQNLQTVAARWNTSVPATNTSISIFVRASDKRLVIKSRHSQLINATGTVGQRQVSSPGSQPSQVQLATYEWPFPAIDDVATSENVSGTGTVVVSGNIMPLQAAGARNTATCKWQFTKGATGSPRSPAIRTIATPGGGMGSPINSSATNAPTAVARDPNAGFVPGSSLNTGLATGANSNTDSVPVTSAGPAVQAAPGAAPSGGTTLPLSNVTQKTVSQPRVVPVTLSPSSGQQATGALGVTVTGWNWSSGGFPDFGSGINVICARPISSTSATYVVGITPTAALGAHTVTFPNGSGQTVKSTFSVTANAPSFSLQPDNAQQGQVLSLTLPDPYGQWYDPNQIGANIHIDFGGDILLSDISFRPTSEKLQVSVSPTAVPGARTIVLTQDAKLQCPVGTMNPHTGKFDQTAQIATPVSYYYLGTFTVTPATSQTSATNGQQQTTSGNTGLNGCNATVHQNGLGQFYKDCHPLGQPGTATYTQVMALESASAYNNDPSSASDISCTQGPGQQSASSVSATANGACAVWTYDGAAAGHVHLDGTGACTCPSVGDGSWN
jgi:hypothetical protein